MTSRIYADVIAEHLTDAGHDSHSARQDSTRTVRVTHDGPDEAHHLEQYTVTLRELGYTVTPEQQTDIRPTRLRVTHP